LKSRFLIIFKILYYNVRLSKELNFDWGASCLENISYYLIKLSKMKILQGWP